MTFDPRPYLKGATSRAKSDVANKLVSMLLHELSRKVSQQTGFSVGHRAYGELTVEYFGSTCPYCQREMEGRRIAVEHLDGMNRLRAGLHVPGNVLVTCADCNREKRRDDQLKDLVLAKTGWESFLSHDSSRCTAECKNCHYWQSLISDRETRAARLKQAQETILTFKEVPEIAAVKKIAAPIQLSAQQLLGEFYRQGQEHAQLEIARMIAEVEKGVTAPSQNPRR